MLLLTLSLGWKIFFGITAFSFIGVLILYIKGCLDADEPVNGTILPYMEDDSEFSPESMISDETIKIASLRNKLNKIEEEQEDEIETVNLNINYSNYEGK